MICFDLFLGKFRSLQTSVMTHKESWITKANSHHDPFLSCRFYPAQGCLDAGVFSRNQRTQSKVLAWIRTHAHTQAYPKCSLKTPTRLRSILLDCGRSLTCYILLENSDCSPSRARVTWKRDNHSVWISDGLASLPVRRSCRRCAWLVSGQSAVEQHHL